MIEFYMLISSVWTFSNISCYTYSNCFSCRKTRWKGLCLFLWNMHFPMLTERRFYLQSRTGPLQGRQESSQSALANDRSWYLYGDLWYKIYLRWAHSKKVVTNFKPNEVVWDRPNIFCSLPYVRMIMNSCFLSVTLLQMCPSFSHYAGRLNQERWDPVGPWIRCCKFGISYVATSHLS